MWAFWFTYPEDIIATKLRHYINKMKTIHLNKVGISKLTLTRWLVGREALPGGKKTWKAQRELLERRTKEYTADEIKLLLDLARGDYRPKPKANKLAVARLGAHLTKTRNALVVSTEKKLAKLSK